MKSCPFCKGRATKLLSLSTGLLTCQQCGRSYDLPGVKDQAFDAVARPAPSKQRLSIRVARRERSTTRGSTSKRSRK